MALCPCRCPKTPEDFAPCYASVLAFGSDGLEKAVRGIEANPGGLVSCFTAWCSVCKGPYLLTTDVAAFPTRSAHHTHKLVLLDSLREDSVFP
jgi:hypothetical protein